MIVAQNADKFDLYQKSVQTAEADANFFSKRFRELTGRPLRTFREDFCGTAQLLCEFVKLHRFNRGFGFDLDPQSLQWCKEHNFQSLTEHQRNRIRLVRKNVISVHSPKVDMIVALNFSYSVFKTRTTLLKYLRNARRCLAQRGVMVLDVHGGSEVLVEGQEQWDVDGFHYTWELTRFDPVSNNMVCKIHFGFPDGSRIRNAFVYDWRLWSIPELRELFAEAGFRKIEVLWESTDRKTGLGNGVLRRVQSGHAEGAWYALLIGQA